MSLLDILQGLIERTYLMQTGVGAVGRYVVGDAGMRSLYGDRRIVHHVGSEAYAEAKLLLRPAADGLYANIYYPDVLIDELERANPMRGLAAHNLVAFAVFVEELDHFLVVAERSLIGRSFSLFELELHANVTKYLVCRHFLERTLRRPLDGGEVQWLCHNLFEAPAPPADPAIAPRYRDADRLGRRYCERLAGLAARERLHELRAFHRRSLAESVRLIRLGAGGAVL